MPTPKIEVENLPKLLRKFDGRLGAPAAAGAFLDRWRFQVEGTAKKNMRRSGQSWIWHGGDRRSLTSDRDHPGGPRSFPLWARVGSNSPTIRFGEFGTGTLSEDPESKKERHFPPVKALAPWATAHGLDPYLVARKIFIRGGLKPRRFLRDAADEADQHVPRWLSQFGGAIEDEARRGSG